MQLIKFYLLALLALLALGCDTGSETEDLLPQHDETVRAVYVEYDSLYSVLGPVPARAALVETLLGRDGVTNPALGRDGVSICWDTELGYEHCFVTETRASVYGAGEENAAAGPSSKDLLTAKALVAQKNGGDPPRALLLAPYRWDGILPESVSNSAAYTSRLLENLGFDVVYASNPEPESDNVGIEDFALFQDFDLVHIVTHGGINSAGVTRVATGERVTPERSEQYRDLMDRGEIATATHYTPWYVDILGPFGEDIDRLQTYTLSSSWFERQYPEGLTETCIVADVCHATERQDLTDALLGEGSVFFGWDNQVAMIDATTASKELITHLAANGLTATQALARLRQDGHDVGCQVQIPTGLCPDPLRTQLRLVGNSAFRLVDAPLRIAATPPFWDDIGALLQRFGHQVTPIELSTLGDPSVLSQFDVVAINCSPDVGEPTSAEVVALRNFVQAGGRLYASDYAFTYVEAAFPDAIDFPENPYGGAVQSITATVRDADLATYLDVPSLDIGFDLPQWVLVDGIGIDTEVLLDGTVAESARAAVAPRSAEARRQAGASRSARGSMRRPLALRFPAGAGEVVFTSFHNEDQLAEEVGLVLEYFTVL